MKRRLAAAVGIAATAAATLAWAARIESLKVDRKSGRYSLYAETFLAAPPDEIFDVLLDYDRFDRISGVYKEHGYLDPAPDGTPIVYTRMEGCMLFYCMSLKRVERLEAERPGHIRTVTLPEQSNFRYSTSEWTLDPVPGGTMMSYSLVMEPDFWVPPIIGPWYLKRTLRRGGTAAINRIERLARAAEDAGDGSAVGETAAGFEALGVGATAAAVAATGVRTNRQSAPSAGAVARANGG